MDYLINPKLDWEGSRVHGDDVAKTVFRMRNGHVEVYGYAFWVNQCTSGFLGVNEPVTREDDRGVTEGREDVREVVQQRGSEAKRKISRCGRNQMGNEPILAFPRRSRRFRSILRRAKQGFGSMLGKREKVIARTSRQLKMLYRGIGRRSEAKNDFELDLRWSDLDEVRTSIWRDVRTLAIEEAYTTKYSIHLGADTMLCSFRLTNRWLSIKGLQDCCYNLSYPSRSGKG
ncbi:hypothetical protein Tco_1160544 [Tanacetum coccineum]